MNYVIKLGVNGIALWVAALLVNGIHLAEGSADWTNRLITVLLVAAIFGVVNAVIKPIAQFLSIPALILTLGLFTFVVNAFMLQLTAWIAGPLHLDFRIDDFFPSALLGALIISLVSWALNIVLPDRDDDRPQPRYSDQRSTRRY